MKPNRSRLLQQLIAFGLLAGFLLGLAASITQSASLIKFAEAMTPLGTLFLNALRGVVIPLVIVVVFSGIAGLGDVKKIGRLGAFTLGFFWLSVFPAILIGMGSMYVGLQFSVGVTMPAAGTPPATELPGVIDFLLSLVPVNPFKSATNGELLPLLVFSAVLAAVVTTLPEKHRTVLVSISDALSAALIRLVHWILWIAPFGIFGLSASMTAELGWELVANLLVFIIAVAVGLIVFISFVYFPLIRFYAGRSIIETMRGILGGAVIAFSATSTVAALPAMLEESTDNLGISPDISSLVLPLGASMYRAGSALFQGAAIVFLAHLYQIPLPIGALGGAILATFLVSLTVAPVPSSGVVTLAPALETIGIPVAGLAVLLGIDRIPDMFRSATNAIGQQTASIVADQWMIVPASPKRKD